ncbi:MAG: AAA family ATPase, partial [Phycisphaerales bacterium]
MPPRAPAPRISAASSRPAIPTKSFTVMPWTGSGQGEKVILYAPSGMGKTTLASMAPDPVFIGVDDGGRMIRNPKTGQPILHVPGIETFSDVRAALQSNVFDDHATAVIDTVTMLQHWGLPFMFATIPHEKGNRVTSIESYGYGKGYRHLFDLMHDVLADCDRLVRTGKNIILIAQEAAVAETNTSGENYLKSGPSLHHSDKSSVRKDYIEWADHVFRIGWEGAAVEDRKITPVKGRMVSVHPDATFEAKSRTLGADCAAVTFTDPKD